MSRRYRRKSSAASIISDTVFIGSKLPWWGAFLLGLITFTGFYFLVPFWLEAKLQENSGSRVFLVLEAIFSRRIHWFEWIGISCGLIGFFFAVRNYFFHNQANYKEQGFVGMLAKLLGRNID